MPTHAAHRLRPAQGVSLVELLIGIVIGLFIVGASLTVLAAHLRENRTLIAQSRLMQDLRTASDLVARDLRRTGYWGAAGRGVWSAPAEDSPASATASAIANPYTALATSASNLAFRYSRDLQENNQVDSNEQFGYRLRNGVLELQLGAASWQAMTDIATMKVTHFDITPTEERLILAGSCTTACAQADQDCPPQLLVRTLAVTLTALGTGDNPIERSVRTLVRLRNDAVLGHCPA